MNKSDINLDKITTIPELIKGLQENLEILKLNLLVSKELFNKGQISVENYCADKEYCTKWTDRYQQCLTLLQLP